MRRRSRLLKKAGLLTLPVFLCSFAMVLATTLLCLAGVTWATGGVRLSDHQSFVIDTAPDGAGGALVTWSSPTADVIYAQRISGSGALIWGSQGVLVCGSSWGGTRSAPRVISDGAGGAIIAWNDDRLGATNACAYAQKISASGVPQWAPGGVLVFASGTSQANPNLVTDGARGAVVTGIWNNGSDNDIIANRVVDPGTCVWGSGWGVVIGGWGVGGNQNKQMMAPDGHGGAFVAWEDTRYEPSKDVYANWVTSTGNPQWGAAPLHDDGVVVCNAAGSAQQDVMVVRDASSGAIVTWADSRRGPAFKDLYANRVNVSGAVQWNGTSGRAVCLSGSVVFPRTIPDGAGGAIVAWQSGTFGSYDVYANRVSSSGVPRWHGTTGTPVCVAAGDNQWPYIATDGLGGALITWRNNGSGEVIRAQRVDSSGSARWVSGGVLVCGAYHQKAEARIAPDGIGGGIIVWGDERSGSGIFYPYARRISNSIWYLAEGTTAWGFETYITIANPNGSAVSAEVTYMPKGRSNITETVSLPASSQTTLTNDHLTEKMGGAFDFSTRVVCNEGKTIAVDRTMSWTGEGASSPEGHSSVGVTSPAATWYLPEGSTNWGFETWLLIQNPNGTTATCEVTYMIEGADPVTRTKEVPPNSRESYSMASDIGNRDASIMVESDVPVIPERAMYKNSRREGHDSIGTTTPARNYYLAEGTTAWGFTTYVLVQNPNPTPANVTVSYLTGSGAKPQAPFTLGANSRKTIRVNDIAELKDTDFSTTVSADKNIIAERAMYWDNGTGEACHDSIGMFAPHSTFYLPDGQTSGSYETWTLVQNPNGSAVSVEVSYLKAAGGAESLTKTIPANSRMTFNMAEKVPSGRASIMVTSKTAGKKIMVERAMYWNNKGAGTDTIGGYSD